MISDFSASPPAAVPRPVAWNHVFVDFENIPRLEFPEMGDKRVTFTILTGARQTRMDMAMVEEISNRPEPIKLIRVASEGKNALDFVLAYHIGLSVAWDATAYYHIVSKDKGFDALVSQLHQDKIRVRRHDDFSTLFKMPAKTDARPYPENPEARAVEHLRRNHGNRPGTERRLISYLRHAMGSTCLDSDVEAVAKSLQARGYLKIDTKEGRVTYDSKRIGGAGSPSPELGQE